MPYQLDCGTRSPSGSPGGVYFTARIIRFLSVCSGEMNSITSLSQRVLLSHQVGLHIDAHPDRRVPKDVIQIMVDRKGQVRAAAAAVDNVDRRRHRQHVDLREGSANSSSSLSPTSTPR
jgi:hypothetical protein